MTIGVMRRHARTPCAGKPVDAPIIPKTRMLLRPAKWKQPIGFGFARIVGAATVMAAAFLVFRSDRGGDLYGR